ncbi:hypothetical protein WN66_04561 [Saccharomyces cerevisiae]|nr:hypothetical protein FOB22_006215 [Saccharomyces cerevisiae]KZV09615.1 hypothetical protein WN66_04561 [Saccharomyces cerevisiae]
MVKGRHSKRKGNFHIILRNASLLQRQKLDKSRSTGSLLESRRQPCVLLSFAKLLLLCIVFSPKLNYTKKKTKILELHQSFGTATILTISHLHGSRSVAAQNFILFHDYLH